MQFRLFLNLFRTPAILALVVGIVVTLACAPAVHAQTSVRTDVSQQLFAVMCALHAAGYQANVSDANFHPVRTRVRMQMLREQGPATEAVREFYKNHLLIDPAATLARYVSFAVSVGRPPDFKFTYNRDELPPEVMAIEGFNEILTDFYKEAKIGELWKTLQPEYEREMRRVQAPLSQIVLVSTSYLREIIRPQSGRTFTVYLEPMVGSKTAFRNVGNDYSIIFSPGTDLPLDEIRHAFLHFLLDQLPLRYKAATNSRRLLLSYAARAPRLPIEYKEDFESFLSECMVKAVELRLSKPKPEALAKALDDADQNGFVLVRPLYREFENNFEKAEPAMSYYFPDLLHAIKLGEEGRRIEKIQFAVGGQAGAHAGKNDATDEAAPAVEETELDRWLREGDREIAARNAALAAETYNRILAKYPGEPRAAYGLAVATVLQGDAEKAKSLFTRILSTREGAPASPGGIQPPVPPLVLAWSHVYLGRIYDLEGSRELALSEYRAALAIDGAPEAARMAARRGIEKGFEAPRPPS